MPVAGEDTLEKGEVGVESKSKSENSGDRALFFFLWLPCRTLGVLLGGARVNCDKDSDDDDDDDVEEEADEVGELTEDVVLDMEAVFLVFMFT